MKARILEAQTKVEENPLKLKEVPDPEPRTKEIRMKAEVEVFNFDQTPEVLILAKQGKIKGSAVIKIA